MDGMITLKEKDLIKVLNLFLFFLQKYVIEMNDATMEYIFNIN